MVGEPDHGGRAGGTAHASRGHFQGQVGYGTGGSIRSRYVQIFRLHRRRRRLGRAPRVENGTLRQPGSLPDKFLFDRPCDVLSIQLPRQGSSAVHVHGYDHGKIRASRGLAFSLSVSDHITSLVRGRCRELQTAWGRHRTLGFCGC